MVAALDGLLGLRLWMGTWRQKRIKKRYACSCSMFLERFMNPNIPSSWTSSPGIRCEYASSSLFECLASVALKFVLTHTFLFILLDTASPAPFCYFLDHAWTYIFLCFVRFYSLKDDDLAGRMGLQPKELNKVIALLSNHRLVQVCVISTLHIQCRG